MEVDLEQTPKPVQVFKDSEVIKLLDNKHWREIVLSPEPNFALLPRITYYWSRGKFKEGSWRMIFKKISENKPASGNELCFFDDAGGECYKLYYSNASKQQRERFPVFKEGLTRNVFHIRKKWGLRVKCWKGPGEIPSTEYSLTIWGQELLDIVRICGIQKIFETESFRIAEAHNCDEARRLHQLKCTIVNPHHHIGQPKPNLAKTNNTTQQQQQKS